MKPQQLALEFHEAFDCLRSDTLITDRAEVFDRMDEREWILQEEYVEYLEARLSGDIVKVARELADVLYVLYGDAVALGIDADAVLAEVHRANMTKVWPDGTVHYREPDGKVLKPPNFEPPNIAKVLGL